jgi:hypothetical protein
MTPGFCDEGPPVEVVREIPLGDGPGEIAGNDRQIAAAAVYAVGDDRLLVADNLNFRINCYRMNGDFVDAYGDDSYRFGYVRNFIVHDEYLIIFVGTQIFFFSIDTLEFVLSVPVPYPYPEFDHTFDPQTDVVFVKNLMICRMYVDLLGVRMERIQASPGLRCTLGGYPLINAMIEEWNRQGAGILLDRERRVYVHGRIVTRDLSAFHEYLVQKIGTDRLNAENGWSQWNRVGAVWGYYFGEDGHGNTYWTAGGAIIVTRGDELVAVTEEITRMGYSLPAVTESGDVYFIGTVSDPDPKAVPMIIGYRLLRIRNAWGPRQ